MHLLGAVVLYMAGSKYINYSSNGEYETVHYRQ